MNLRVFLSDRCNMTCGYCFLRLNRGPAVVLEEKALRRAIEAHLERHGSAASVTFLGGEPLLHWELLLAGLQAVRSRSESAAARVVTNATLLRPERLLDLRNFGAEVVVSLDGASPTHDRHRRMAYPGGGPSYDLALAVLPELDRRGLRINMVVREETAPALIANLAHLSGLGLRRISFHLDVLERWTESGLEALRRVLGGLGRLSGALGPKLRLTHLDSYRILAERHAEDDIVLGADGRYYPCDGLFARSYGEISDWAVGDTMEGLDEARREKLLSEARAAIHGAIGGEPHYTCARETYFHERAAGRDPAPAVRAFHRADRVFGEALAALASAHGAVA